MPLKFEDAAMVLPQDGGSKRLAAAVLRDYDRALSAGDDMGETTETIVGLAIMAAILLVSAWITNLFARKMYHRCVGCGLLNAKRRAHCRGCGQAISRQ